MKRKKGGREGEGGGSIANFRLPGGARQVFPEKKRKRKRGGGGEEESGRDGRTSFTVS